MTEKHNKFSHCERPQGAWQSQKQIMTQSLRGEGKGGGDLGDYFTASELQGDRKKGGEERDQGTFKIKSENTMGQVAKTVPARSETKDTRASFF